jgi:hypothetical protein
MSLVVVMAWAKKCEMSMSQAVLREALLPFGSRVLGCLYRWAPIATAENRRC